MDNIQKLHIKINVSGGIEGVIDEYKYNKNTQPRSKDSIIYVPTSYDISNANIEKYSPYNKIDLFLNKDRLREVGKRFTSKITEKSANNNAKFIIKLLFKKGTTFYIRNNKFTIGNPVAVDDITILPTTTIKKTDSMLRKEALVKKHKEIIKDITTAYADISSDKLEKYYKSHIQKEIAKEYEDFLTNKTEYNRYINNYIAEHKKGFNIRVTIALNLIPSGEIIKYAARHGFYVPSYKGYDQMGCKTQKQKIYKEFIKLLCTTSSTAIPGATKKKFTQKIKDVTKEYIGDPGKDLKLCPKDLSKIKIVDKKILKITDLPYKSLPSSFIKTRTKLKGGQKYLKRKSTHSGN